MSTKDLDELVSDFSRFYVLTILYEDPQHGYSIIHKFRERVGKEISPSLVYPFLRKLEVQGLVKHSMKPVGKRRKKVFELTDEGRNLSKQLFKRFSALISVALEPSVEICAHCGCKVYEGGYSEKIERKEMTFCCIHCAQSYKREKTKSSGKLKSQKGVRA